MNDLSSGIRKLLGDAPDEARRADERDRQAAEDQTGGVTETNQMDENVTGVDRRQLSTADVANAAAAPAATEEVATHDSYTVGTTAAVDSPDTARTADGGWTATDGATARQPDAGAPVERSASADRAAVPDRPATDRPAAAPQAPLAGRPEADRAVDVRAPAVAQQAPGVDATDGTAPLFPSDEASGLRDRWTDVQAGFVDEPRQAVKQADGLVAEVIQKLAASFADERSKLERQWDRGEDVSTEDLRLALRRYRSFFDRLLSL